MDGQFGVTFFGEAIHSASCLEVRIGLLVLGDLHRQSKSTVGDLDCPGDVLPPPPTPKMCCNTDPQKSLGP